MQRGLVRRVGKNNGAQIRELPPQKKPYVSGLTTPRHKLASTGGNDKNGPGGG
jgi:hypothetical protein